MLEVVLNRRSTDNDWKGLQQSISDNIPTPIRIRALLERKIPGLGEAGQGHTQEYASQQV